MFISNKNAPVETEAFLLLVISVKKFLHGSHREEHVLQLR